MHILSKTPYGLLKAVVEAIFGVSTSWSATIMVHYGSSSSVGASPEAQEHNLLIVQYRLSAWEA